MHGLRERHGLSQPKFAAVMGISVGTLRNWELGRRVPEGSARALLRVVERYPEAVFDAVSDHLTVDLEHRKEPAALAAKRAARRR